MIKKKKSDEIFMWLMRELYKKATPSADFDLLVANATINERGEKVIPFNDYEISMEEMNGIIEESFVKFKVKYKYDKQIIKNTIYLGCSPKTKQL